MSFHHRLSLAAKVVHCPPFVLLPQVARGPDMIHCYAVGVSSMTLVIVSTSLVGYGSYSSNQIVQVLCRLTCLVSLEVIS